MVIKRGLLRDLIKEATNDFVFYELLDTQLQLDAMTKLKVVSPYAMGLSYENIEFKAKTDRLNKQELSHQSLIDLFETYYNDSQRSPLTQKQKEFLEQIIVEASHETT